MKAFIILPTFICALLALFPYPSTAQPRNETLEEVEIQKKIRIQVVKDDAARSEESSEGQNHYGEIFLLDSTSMRYELIEDTAMSDMSGNKVSPDQFRTPCTVKLVIQKLDSGYANILKLDVKSCSSNASSEWFESSGD